MPVSTAMYFDEDGYFELTERAGASSASLGGPIGRHVAGKEFLTAYIRHSQAQEFFAVARNARHARSLIKFAVAARLGLPSRQLRVFVGDSKGSGATQRGRESLVKKTPDPLESPDGARC